MLEAKIVAGGQRPSSSLPERDLEGGVLGDRLDRPARSRPSVASSVVQVSRASAVSRAGGVELLLVDQPIERGADRRLPAPQGRLAHVPHHGGEAGDGGRLSDAAAHEAAPATPIRSKGTLPLRIRT